MGALIALPAILWLAHSKGQLSLYTIAASSGFVLWCAYSLRVLYLGPLNASFTIKNLIAGFCAVDLMALGFYGSLSPINSLLFVALFFSTLLLQRKISGT